MLNASELSDLEEIRRLNNDYFFGLDTGDLDILTAPFAKDATFDMRAATLGVYSGLDEIRHYFGTSQLPKMEGQIHLATNHRIDLDGDVATGTVYHLVHGTSKNGSTIFAGGYHTDTYVRTADGWRIKSKVASSLLKADMRAVGGDGER